MREAIVYLHDDCNYTCSYCLLNQPWYKRQRGSRVWSAEGLTSLTEFFREWTIMLTGGEPTWHPRFVELAAGLAEHNRLRLDTNNSLTVAQWQDFVRAVPREKVDWLHCSLHEADSSPERLSPWLERLVYLRAKGYQPWVTWVVVPEQIGMLPQLSALLGGEGIPFVPTLLRTDVYPAAYTAAEREMFDHYCSSAVHRGLLDTNVRSSKGRLCPGGERRLQVNAISGNIYRCFRDDKPLGNIYSGEETILADKPLPCPWDSCSYFFEHQLDTEEIYRRDLEHILAGNPRYDQELYKDFLACFSPTTGTS